jgi:hypothetical protein
MSAPSQTPPWDAAMQATAPQYLYDAGAIVLGLPITFLDNTSQPAEPLAVTIPDGNYVRQTKQIVVPAANELTTSSFRVTGNFVGFVSLLFSTIGTSAVLVWDGAGWHLQGGNALAEREV